MSEEKVYKVYIIGPFKGTCYPETEYNVSRAKELANKIRKDLKLAVYCPHEHRSANEGVLDNHEKFERDLEVLSKCEFAITMDLSNYSMPCNVEVYHAKQNKVTILNSYFSLKKKVETPKVA